MTTQRTILAGLAIALAIAAPAMAMVDEPLSARGNVESVTVYRGQALVTRLVSVDAPAGDVEIVVTDLPEGVLGPSLFASGDDGIRIQAVRYRTRAVADEPREEVRALLQQIEEVQRELRLLAARKATLARLEAYVANMETFAAAQARSDLDRGTLNADALREVTAMIFDRRTELMEKSVELDEEQREAQERLNLLQRQRQELATRHTRSLREAVLFLNKPQNGASAVRLSYLVRDANWSPTYNLRAQGDRDQIRLEYSALIQQASGEDWNGVQLTLSTASPSMVAEAPVVGPLWVTLRSSPTLVAARLEEYSQQQRAYNEEVQVALRGRTLARDGLDDNVWRANAAANRLQLLDLVGTPDILRAGREIVSQDDVLSVTYTLPDRLNIPSRRDQQMIRIADLNLASSFHYQAAPMLTPYVYQQAEVTNDGDLALLAGPINSYLDGQFMGMGQLPLVAMGQRFTVGFGVDSQLRASREMVDKSERVLGGNREVTINYRLLVDNYKDRPVRVRLLERLPEPHGADIRVTLLNASDEISDEPVYQRTLRRSGILRWDVDVPANSLGAESRTLEYAYRMEFDRNMHLAEPEARQLEEGRRYFEEQIRNFRSLN